MQIGAVANDKVALVNGQTNDISFSNNTINFTDTTTGGLSTGQYVLFTADVANAYSGLTVGGSGNITAGLTVGTGLSSYSNLSLQVVGNNIVLNLTAPTGPPPGAPTGLTVTNNYNGVSLSWTSPGAAASYNIKRATVSGGPYTTIATGVATTSYTDSTASIGGTYDYVVSASNSNGEGVNSSQVSTTVQGAGVSINLKPAADTGMTSSDVAGAARLAKWNNLNASSTATTKSVLLDNTGAVVAGMSTTFTGGSGGPAYTMSSADSGNDATMIRGVYDQYNGTAGTISISGIPYATYDLYLYMWSDQTNRAGSFQVNSGTTYYMRGGVGNPTSSGTGYVRSQDTTTSAAARTLIKATTSASRVSPRAV